MSNHQYRVNQSQHRESSHTSTMPDVESTIAPKLAAYIDSTKLEKLLKGIFGEDILVYVSVAHLAKAETGDIQFRGVADNNVSGKEWGVQFHCAESTHRGSLTNMPCQAREQTC
jgi:hypothetical protein